MSGDVSSDSILLAEHGLVSGLGEFWGKLAFDVVVVTCSRWGSVEHINCWDCFAESLLPAFVHSFGGLGHPVAWWGVFTELEGICHEGVVCEINLVTEVSITTIVI